MDAPLLLSLARDRARTHGDLGLEGAWASGRALGLSWRKEGWVFLLQPRPELWLLPTAHPAWKRLESEAGKDSGRAWGAWLKGARLREVLGDPRERWLGLVFQRRAITGRLETVRLAFQAIPGRAGLRLDGVDVQAGRLGLGVPFAAAPPEPGEEPPPLKRWREAWGERLDAALAGHIPEVLEGEGSLAERHGAWSQRRAQELILGPVEAARRRVLDQEGKRLEKLAAVIAQDRIRHEAGQGIRTQAARLSAELWRLKGATGIAELLDGSKVELPVGDTAEAAAQRWFQQAKKAERGLQRVAELEGELARGRADHARKVAAFEAGETAPAPVKMKGQAKEKKPVKDAKGAGKRADGKGKAFRSVMIDGFEVLIGKGDAENDQLTFKVADNLDLWLHVASHPGSHVVIRNPDKLSELPREVVERAAELAAFHSKAKDGGKVEVHVARIADISKPKGFAPGKVILKKWTGVRVYPKP
ncbi:MAG TPA: NFACT RNA binding domain-containing protein [Holophagaceae bacterium]|nr:NFACT RNA binding domain-containing protein [Holophagaceae bacterium]